MEINKNKEKSKSRINWAVAGKITGVFLRWFYIAALFGVIFFAYFTWSKYVQNAEWSDAQKRAYVNEQAVFSFDKSAFLKAVDFYNEKRARLMDQEKFSGPDIFFPEGF